MRSTFKTALAILLVTATGCQCVRHEEPPPPPEDAGVVTPPRDSGVVKPPDKPVFDAGPVFTYLNAAEPCPSEIYTASDGGTTFGVCIVLRGLSGVAKLNGNAAPSAVNVHFQSSGFQSEIDAVPTAAGDYEVRVMRSRYERLEYHPEGIFPTHQGPVDFGAIDMTVNRTKDFDVTTHRLRGKVSFGGQPWQSVPNPYDVQLGAFGTPSYQGAAMSNTGGSYDVALIAGSFGVALKVPRDALGQTEIGGWLAHPFLVFNQDQTLDIEIPAAELEGELLLDGAPFPDRMMGDDFRLQYVSVGSSSEPTDTWHEGGVPQFHAIVPRGKYTVLLALDSSPHPELPSELINKQLGVVDLNQNAATRFQLATHRIEGSIAVDGVPAKPVPNYNWYMFTYAYASGTEPYFLAYYDVPFTSPTFKLRAFPATYQIGLWIDENFAAELVQGWFYVDRQYTLASDSILAIDIETSELEGTLFIDGQPAPAGQAAGYLYLQGDGYYRRRVVTQDDGSFRLRVPKGTYDVYFEIDNRTFPNYAVGRFPMQRGVDLNTTQQVALNYQTSQLSGPLRVAGEVVADTLPGREFGMRLSAPGSVYTWSFESGRPDYSLRIPKGDYSLTFEIERDAIPYVAHGSAPMGVRLPVK